MIKIVNEILNLKYGFICVKSNIASHYSIIDISKLEREYFVIIKYFNFYQLMIILLLKH